MCICVPAREGKERGETQDTAMHESNGDFTYFLAMRVRVPGKRGQVGGGRVRGRGELGDIDGGLVVRGVGGSTGCPECRGVSRDKLQAGQRMRKKKGGFSDWE